MTSIAHDLNEDGPLDQHIVLWREGWKPMTNVEHTWVLHSPDGFEWGYSGSGPADLALNILLTFVPNEPHLAETLHQRFKVEFLVKMPKAGGSIHSEMIKGWIAGARVLLMEAMR